MEYGKADNLRYMPFLLRKTRYSDAGSLFIGAEIRSAYRILKTAERFRKIIGKALLNPNKLKAGCGFDPEQDTHVNSK